MGVEEVALDPANVRLHDDRNLAAIRGSLVRFGQRKPIVLDAKGVVRAGNGLATAAQQLGWKKVWAVLWEDLEGHEATQYAIVDNRSGDLSTWDYQGLADQLGGLLADDLTTFDELGELGWSPEELEPLLAGDFPGDDDEEGTEEDGDAGDPPPVPETQPGDLYLLGDHRLVCGDATEPGVVEKALDGAQPLLMVTDPPYGVSYDPDWRSRAIKQVAQTGRVHNDHTASWRDAFALFPGPIAYCWHGGLHASEVELDLSACELLVRAQIIWVKDALVISRGAYHWQHEACWYAVRKGAKGHWTGGRKQATTWEIANLRAPKQAPENEKTGHGTQKPVECMGRPIRNHGAKGALVYDPFVGSGTTIVAAEQLGRRCAAVELDPGYCDVVVGRWERLTGRTAERVRR
jgi:DNA modification methylase